MKSDNSVANKNNNGIKSFDCTEIKTKAKHVGRRLLNLGFLETEDLGSRW